MSTAVIVVIIVVVVVALAALVFMLPRIRASARVRRRQAELDRRREHAVNEHREEAAAREQHAEAAEQRARMAAAEAERERAQARIVHEKADLHERGLADQELVEDHERDHFEGTSALEHDPSTERENLDRHHENGAETARIGDAEARQGDTRA